ncbi:sugar efflux transporter [Enterovibrio sp. ZSDZ35]|uniref:Sugar efflux transporter n=1 Tax=Enterovibrio qingdaonensis TaxID=2899818 RepID=A0ABT5QQL7_9GAMM|nr:sugar efflux transporter [Enterovibrio sp. ZSDZ35]MDD1783282.1 sugar efflux transporter [Enterovibrio sp. ZSDZ35]
MKSYLHFLVRKEPLCYLLICLFAGLGGGFFMPLMSLFVIDGLGASPSQMGVYLALSVVSGVFVSQLLATLSDYGWERRRIIALSQAAFIVTMLLFVFIRNYYLALVVTIFVFSVSCAAMPQTFALGREFADQKLGENSTIFVSLMRAMMSLAWVIGPPIAFIVKDIIGFNGAFLFAALVMSVSVIVVLNTSPFTTQNAGEKAGERATVKKMPWRKIAGVPMYLGAVLMLFWANNMYVITIPLYVTKELSLSGSVAGQLLGLAAFLEIPIMVFAGLWAIKIAPQKLMVLSASIACVFYVLLFNAEQLWQMYALQILNGFSVGISASLGMVVIQNKMPNQMGTATTLFNNSMMVASLMSSLTVGMIAELYSYHYVMIAMMFAGVSALLLLTVSLSREKARESENFATERV